MNDLAEYKEFLRLHAVIQSTNERHFQAILSKIIQPEGEGKGSWAFEFTTEGDRFFQTKQYEEALQYYNFARFPFVSSPLQQRAYQRCQECFQILNKKNALGFSKEHFLYGGKEIPFYFKKKADKAGPLLIVMGGIVSIKEQWLLLAKMTEPFNFSLALVDMPGMEGDIFQAIIEALAPFIHSSKIHIIAFSFAGNVALRAALSDFRIVSIFTVSAPLYHFFTDSLAWKKVPGITKKTLANLFQCKNFEIFEKMQNLALPSEMLAQLKIPVYYIASEHDEIIQSAELAYCKTALPGVKLHVFDDSHGGPNSMKELKALLLDYLTHCDPIASLPPGPTQNKFSQMRQFIRHPLDFFERCRATYGKIFTLRLLGQAPYVVISDPAHLKQIFTASSEELHAGEINAVIFEPILGKSSLLTLDEAKHLAHRKLMLPSFHGERMNLYGAVMSEFTQQKIKEWKVGSAFPVFDEVQSITFSIILKSIFGIDEKNEQFQALGTMIHRLIREIKKPFGMIVFANRFLHRNLGFLTPWAKIMKLRKEVDAILFSEIESRRETDYASRIDILSLLLQARYEAGEGMTNQEIRDEMLTLLIAGHETTTTGIAWTLYWILSNPEVCEAVKVELAENADKTPYLEACIKESLRLTPVVPYITRLTQSAYQLGDYLLPKGTVIVPSIYLAHRDPTVWANPMQFRPERFLGESEQPYTYLPFGGGTRRCIGATFAQYEMKIILSEILRHAELTLKLGYRPKLIRKGVVISPSDGVPVILKQTIF